MADSDQNRPNWSLRRLYEQYCGCIKLFLRADPAPGKQFETEWSELTPDLLRLIAKKLGDISNFVRFRVVCKQWRSAVSSSDLPPQLPWLLERRHHYLSSDIKFFSLYSNKTHTLHVPMAQGRMVYVTTKSYLLLKDLVDFTSIFTNPLTRHIRNANLKGPIRKLLVSQGYDYRRTDTNKICDAILIQINGTCKFKICSCLDCEGTDSTYSACGCCDGPTTFYKGNLFGYCYRTKNTVVIDIRTGGVVSVIPRIPDRIRYFINAYDDLLGVVVENYYSRIVDDWRYKVYRLEQGSETPFWAEMSQGIGDLVLFIDKNGGFCLKASDFDGLEGNKIYFRKRVFSGGFYLGMYDLEKATTKLLMDPREGKNMIIDPTDSGAWFVPSL